MIEKLKIQKICYDETTYENLKLDEEWLKRNDFNKIITKHEGSWSSPIKQIIIEKNNGDVILLESDDECKIFFNKHK